MVQLENLHYISQPVALDRVAMVHATIRGAFGGEEMEFNRGSALVAASEIT